MTAAPPSLAPIRVPGETTFVEREYRKASAALLRCARTVATFDAAIYDPRAVEEARTMWSVRAAAEYRSTTVFAAMAGQLVEARAPMATTAVVLRMGQDEVRHADACLRAVALLGGEPSIGTDMLVRPLTRHPGTGPEERALRNVIYGCCLSEVVNTARFVDTLDTMSDPYLRDVTRDLLADEVLHGQFGFHYLDEMRDWLAAHIDVRASIGRYLVNAFAFLERQLSGAGGAPRALTDDQRALGLPDPKRLPETFYATVEGAIVPGLERFGIDAGAAWKARRLPA